MTSISRMTSISTSSAAFSSRPVVLPVITELFDTNFLDVLLPVTTKQVGMDVDRLVTPTPGNPMIDALKASAHRTFTANGAPAFSSTLSSVLDAFNGLSQHTFGPHVGQYLNKAWQEDPDLTLHLIWNLRSIHDGVGDKELFYRAFGWLYDHHPRTAISNLHLLVEPVCIPRKKKAAMSHGYWKDLLNILALATVDELSNISQPSEFLHCPRSPFTYGRYKTAKTGTPASRIEATQRANDRAKATAEAKRKTKYQDSHKRLVARLSNPKFRALYIAVARLFADQLVKDINVLSEIEKLKPEEDRMSLMKRLSLAGKWAPTPGGAHDRVTNIATAVAELLYASRVLPAYPSALNSPLPARERALILRSFYQRWVLTELRRISGCPEPLMSAKRWTEIKYTRVPSIAMKNNTPHFFKHDPKGFEEYLLSVESNKKSISGATLLPHELVGQVVSLSDKVADGSDNKKEFKRQLAKIKLRVVEAQWKTLIDNLRAAGSLENALAVCDVSGSMGHIKDNEHIVQPILPAVALSLVLASLAKAPFNGGFITFSERPQYVQVDLAQSLYDQVTTMSNADWGENTDLGAVFLNLLLPLAVQNNIKQEDMIKRLFIFSDMQFDQCYDKKASATHWATNYDVIERAYKEAGYEVPQIVYWDLAGAGVRKTMEVESDRKGVAMMNGFSPAMLKVFMGEEEAPTEEMEWENVGEDGESVTVVDKMEEDPSEFNPLNVMKKALLRPSYNGLVVVD